MDKGLHTEYAGEHQPHQLRRRSGPAGNSVGVVWAIRPQDRNSEWGVEQGHDRVKDLAPQVSK